MIKETLKKMGYKGRGISYGVDKLYFLTFGGDLGFQLDLRTEGVPYGHINFWSTTTYKSDKIEELQNLLNILGLDYKLKLGKPRDKLGKEIPMCVENNWGLVEIDSELLEIKDKDVLRELIEYHRESTEETHKEILSVF